MLLQGSFLSSLLNLLPQKGMIKMVLTIYAVVATVFRTRQEFTSHSLRECALSLPYRELKFRKASRLKK